MSPSRRSWKIQRICLSVYEYSGTPLFVQTKISYIFSKINPLNTDTDKYGQRTLFFVPSDKLSHIVNLALRTLVNNALSILGANIIVSIVPFSNNGKFLRVKMILLQEKKKKKKKQ